MSPSKNRLIATLGAAAIAATLLVAGVALRAKAQNSADDEVLAMQKKFTDACVAADGATLNKVMADNAVFIHGNGVMQSKAEFIDAITTGKLGVSQYDLKDPKLGQIEFFDEDIDHANRIVLADPVFQAFRKQRGLTAINPLNEAPHPILPHIAQNYPANDQAMRFYTGWVTSDRLGVWPDVRFSPVDSTGRRNTPSL